MSKLYHTENGHAIPTLAEELTTFRRARKKLDLPPTEAPAKLYFMARAWTGSRVALRLAINGTEIAPVAPELDVHWWYTLTIDPGLLKGGENIFEFWCDSRPMNAWSLAIEPGHGNPDSFISDDAGATWRNNRMCYLNALSGEYLVRVRLAKGNDLAPPPMVFNDPAHPRLAALREILPPAARDASLAALERVRAICYLAGLELGTHPLGRLPRRRLHALGSGNHPRLGPRSMRPQRSPPDGQLHLLRRHLRQCRAGDRHPRPLCHLGGETGQSGWPLHRRMVVQR